MTGLLLQTVSKRWFGILFFFCSIGSIAQVPQAPNAFDEEGNRTGKWVILKDKKFKDVRSQSLASYYRVITYQRGKPEGLVEDFRLDGTPYWKGNLLSEIPFVRNGASIYYHSNGRIKSDGTYRNNLRHGLTTWYSENGLKESSGFFKDGKEDGLSTWYYPSGQVKTERTYKKRYPFGSYASIL